MLESQKYHTLRDRTGKVVLDIALIAISAVLSLYIALNSITPLPYAGSGFQGSNWNLTESVVVLFIFFFGVFRLILDLRSRGILEKQTT
jgi:hypothetical protein